jgi:diguanylate cyclase (GGDEF)-like protein/PAS domain S-box-containing protein
VNIHLAIAVGLLALAAVVLTVLMRRAWDSRSLPGAWAFLATDLLGAGWAVTTAFELASPTLSAKLMWDDAEFLFIAFLSVAVLTMVLDYTGHRSWLTPVNLLLLCLVPFLTVVFTWTNHQHLLMRTDAWLDLGGPYPRLAWSSGPWFLVHSAYSFLLLTVSLGVLLRAVVSSPAVHRRGPLVMLCGLLVPALWNLLDLVHPQSLPATDLTPAVFSVTGFIFAWGLFRSELFALVPVARHTLVESISDGILVLDAAGRIADLNSAAREIVGRPGEPVLGRPVEKVWQEWQQLAGPCLQGAPLALLTLESGSRWRKYEVKITRLSKGNRLIGQLFVFRDATDRAVMEESLRVQALTDGLTGLGNRTLFMEKLSDALRQAQRHPERSFAVVILDLDRFKQVNDTVGHLAGDVLLQHVADRLAQCIRDIDTLARLGGDEFMLLLDGIADRHDLAPILDRIQREVQRPASFRGQEISTTTSMGAVIWDPSYLDPEDLLHAADTALYQAKEAGRDCYRLFDEQMHRSLLLAARVETELRAALSHQDFCLLYQPVLDVATGQVTTLEAFVRWKDARRGLVPPGDFLELAENTGLIVPLGELILDQVCRQLRLWRDSEGPAASLAVSLNLSPRQLLETDLVGAVLARVAEWRVPPGSLVFEVTESALLKNPAKARRSMAELCSMGMRVCLDDFGVGFSSLQHLTAFPLNEIKLDRTLVARLPHSSTDLEIARSVINLAHTLGLTVTGEGVEQGTQWQVLADLGCDHLQGFYLSPPVGPAEVLRLLADWAARSPTESRPLGPQQPVKNAAGAGRAARPTWLRLVREHPGPDQSA